MTGNPFLDPSREIQQGRTDEDILTAHERRLAEAAADAAMRRPAGVSEADSTLESYKRAAEKSIDEKFKMPLGGVAAGVAASMAAGAAGMAGVAGAAVGVAAGTALGVGLGASLYGSWASEKLKEKLNYTPKEEEKKNLNEFNLNESRFFKDSLLDRYQKLYEDDRDEGDDGAA